MSTRQPSSKPLIPSRDSVNSADHGDRDRPIEESSAKTPEDKTASSGLTHIYGVTAQATNNTYGVTTSYTLRPIIGPQWYATEHLATSNIQVLYLNTLHIVPVSSPRHRPLDAKQDDYSNILLVPHAIGGSAEATIRWQGDQRYTSTGRNPRRGCHQEELQTHARHSREVECWVSSTCQDTQSKHKIPFPLDERWKDVIHHSISPHGLTCNAQDHRTVTISSWPH
jgi:hypothetical protein